MTDVVFYQVGPTVIHPQYYSVQTPWGIYPANIIPAQGQQTPQGMTQVRSGSGRLTPSGQSDSGSQIQQPLPTPGSLSFEIVISPFTFKISIYPEC